MSTPASTAQMATLIDRPGLVARLDATAPGAVLLVGAPAGGGKTELIRSWVGQSTLDAAWVGVERAESDPHRFWSLVIGALRGSPAADRVSPLPPTPAFDAGATIDALCAQLDALAVPIVLVVDDLHELSSSAVLAELEAFLLQLPPSVRVVLAFRGSIRMRLHRLRLAGRLSEIDTNALRFTADETRAVLASSGLQLCDADVQTIHQRTEGWPAGVRLAALALADHPDPQRVVREFSGTNRMVSDYLFAEVLERQCEQTRSMLLRTSIVERVSGPLADALTGDAGSDERLRQLEDSGAFVVSLDSDRTWFRYHRLFADLLRLELRRTAPQEVRPLHDAAARWFAAQNHVVEAIRHAQAAEDWALAIGLLADHYFSLTLDGRQATVRDLLHAFPMHAMATDPQLALVIAADEAADGSLEASVAQLTLAERYAADVPRERRRRFAAGVALVRLTHARRRGDFASVRDLALPVDLADHPETWLDLTMNDDLRIWALMSVGILEAWTGQSDAGALHLEEALALARRVGRPYLDIACRAHLASTVSRRSFIDAQLACYEVIDAAERAGLTADPVVAPALVTLAASLTQTGHFAEAGLWLERAEQTLMTELEPAVACLFHGVTGSLALAQHRLADAGASLARAAGLAARLASPMRLYHQFRSAALTARVACGDLAGVRAALDAMSDEERAVGEMQEAVATLTLAEGDAEAALAILAPILDGSLAVHHPVVVIRSLLRAATIHARSGSVLDAEAAVERALHLAETDHLIVPFAHVDCYDVLTDHPRHRTAHGALLNEVLDVLAGAAPPASSGDPAPLREELTDVELRVLRYLPSNLTTPEIAAELYLSVNTVKTHLRHIYAKLGAHTRAQALERARALGLLSRRSRRT